MLYAYNAQVLRSTSPTPFNLVLSRQPLEPVMFSTSSALPTDTYHETHPQVLRKQLLIQIQALQFRVDDRLRTAQNRYKQKHDPKVCRIQPFTSGQTVFFNTPLLAANMSGHAEQSAQFFYKTLMPQRVGPFSLLSVTLHTLPIDKNEVYDTVTIDWASSAPVRP